MTTIATDGRTMAGDSLVTASGEIVGYHDKVKRIKDGRIVGVCGPMTDAIKFVRWIDSGGDKPTISEDFCALVLNTDGTVDYFNSEFEPCGYIAPMAIGSGDGIAIGAMLAGKSPAQAVAIAATRCTNTGGEITVLGIDPPLKAVA